MRGPDGRQVPGAALLRLGVFTAVVVGLGIAALVYGFTQQGGRGVAIVVLALIALAANVAMWSAIALTQRRRRNLEPPR